MIVDTETGEVLNPRIIHSDSRIVSHAYSHAHHYDHYHHYPRSYRSNFSAARRNTIPLLALFAIILVFLNYFAKVNGNGRDYTFYSLLTYFSDVDNFVDLNFFDDITTYFTNNAAFLQEALSYRVPDDSVFSFVNVFLNIFDTIHEVMISIGQALYFCGECILTLMSFIFSIIGFIF